MAQSVTRRSIKPMYIQAADYTCTTKLHHTLCNACVETETVQQNVTASYHNVHKLSIRCHLWETVQDSGVKAYEMDKKCIVW
jgi:hypothetical protein